MQAWPKPTSLTAGIRKLPPECKGGSFGIERAFECGRHGAGGWAGVVEARIEGKQRAKKEKRMPSA